MNERVGIFIKWTWRIVFFCGMLVNWIGFIYWAAQLRDLRTPGSDPERQLASLLFTVRIAGDFLYDAMILLWMYFWVTNGPLQHTRVTNPD